MIDPNNENLNYQEQENNNDYDYAIMDNYLTENTNFLSKLSLWMSYFSRNTGKIKIEKASPRDHGDAAHAQPSQQADLDGEYFHF